VKQEGLVFQVTRLKETPLVRLENQPRDARRGFSLSVIQSQLFLVELRCLFSESLNLAV
jgi:hypothetical protein